MAEIKKAYGKGCAARARYIHQAQENERLTIILNATESNPLAGQRRIDLYSDRGPKLVQALASTLVSLQFPPNVWWMNLKVQTEDPNFVETTDMKVRFTRVVRSAMGLFDQLGVVASMTAAHIHSMVASQIVWHTKQADDKGPDRIRLFPLWRHVTEYQDSELVRIIVEEDVVDPNGAEDQTPKKLYTEIDFVKDQIRQEFEDEITEVDDGDNPRRWFVVSQAQPLPGEHFATAYVTHFIARFIHLNGLTRAFRQAVFEASKILKAVRAGSGLDPHALNRLSSSAFITMRRPDDIFFPQLQAPLVPGLAAVAEAIQTDTLDLNESFLYGLLSRNPLPNTATLTEHLVAQQQNVGGHLFRHHDAYTLRPLARSLLDLMGFRVEGSGGSVEPVIVTGLSALSRQMETRNLEQTIAFMAQAFPDWAAQMPANRIFQRISTGMQIETDDLNPDNADVADLLKQLIGKIQEDPQTVLPMLLRLIQEFDPTLLESVAGQVQQTATVSQPAIAALPDLSGQTQPAA